MRQARLRPVTSFCASDDVRLVDLEMRRQHSSRRPIVGVHSLPAAYPSFKRPSISWERHDAMQALVLETTLNVSLLSI